MSSWLQDFNITKQLYSLSGIPHALNVWMFECSSECVGTIAEEFGDFSTVPPREILIKAGLASPELPEQPLKRRKTVTFQQDSPVVMDDDTSTRDRSVYHVSGLYSETQNNATDKGRENDLKNEDGSDLKILENEIMAYEEEGSGDELKKKHISDVEDLLYDEVGRTVTDSIQAAVDSILFGLSTPSTTKSLDVSSSNKMIESQWDLLNSQIPPDFPDAQLLAVIVWKEKLICVYDSLPSKRKKEPPIEIQKVAVMLSTYLLDNGFYEKTERIDWPPLEAYKGKLAQQTGLVNEILFDVDYVQNILQ
ncbi:hypothetical protein CQW23_07339 [Capsicum baccatum]|uniref:Uncharacterized protein n=1 Tax=Capsicum baccatum TaxID=33114 RepID=A0A2G2X5Y5_CAPBA|nr:hypothetical protein CQW23_07339 [Capsicum baccatum]